MSYGKQDDNHNSNLRDGREHALVYAEEQIWNAATADGGIAQHALQTKILEITDELAGAVREGKRVAPEEPLERDYCCGHDGPVMLISGCGTLSMPVLRTAIAVTRPISCGRDRSRRSPRPES